jgi:uncharacterized membrane protein
VTAVPDLSSPEPGSQVSRAGRLVPALLALVALAGLGIAAYLTAVHYANVPLACSRQGPVDCGAVTHSSFSVLPGTQVPITVPGMAWFVLSGLAALVATRAAEPPWLAATHAIWGLLGVATVLYLVYAEVVVIHRICEWCSVVHLLILVTFALTLYRLQRTAMEEG